MNSIPKYERVALIGQGAFAVVYKARDIRTGEIFALKKIVFKGQDDGVPVTAIREIGLLKKLEHENIVMLKDVVHIESKLHLVFEFMDRDLKQYLDTCGPEGLDPELVKSYLFQLLRGVAFCHANRILHRDLKPQNLLLDRTGQLKLADFGLARAFEIPLRMYTHEVVTLWYRAPEILLGSTHYTTPVDVWSVGCIFAEMVSRVPLFPGDSEIDQLLRIFRVRGTPNESTWPMVSTLEAYMPEFPSWPPLALERVAPGVSKPGGLELLDALLQLDPTRRLTAEDALDHPYFSSVLCSHSA